MTKLMKKIKSRKGFTLVEIIIVLVILAILAAIMIPSLTGYIDKANSKAIVSETRSAVMAAQTLASEEYAGKSLTPGTVTISGIKFDLLSSSATAGQDKKDIKNLAEVKGDIVAYGIQGGKIAYLFYQNGNKLCVYTNGSTYSNCLDFPSGTLSVTNYIKYDNTSTSATYGKFILTNLGLK